MSDIAIGIHVVRVLMDSGVGDNPTVQLWVAAVPRDQAVEAVQAAIPAGWTAEMTDSTLSKDTVARLGLRAGEVRSLT